MSETKFTPGPWSQRPYRFQDTDHAHIVADGVVVASVREGNIVPEYIANARLIATAPEMATESLFLLERLDEWERDHIGGGEGYRDWAGHVVPAIARLRQILLRAVSPQAQPDSDQRQGEH